MLALHDQKVATMLIFGNPDLYEMIKLHNTFNIRCYTKIGILWVLKKCSHKGGAGGLPQG